MQRGVGTTFGGDNINSIILVAVIDAPQTAFTVKNTATLEGRATFKTIDSKNNLELYYDESLDAAISGISKPYSLVIVE